MILSIVLLFSFSICFSCEILDNIIKNNPKMSRKRGKVISKIIKKYSSIYDIDGKLFSSILAQESMYRLDARGGCNSSKRNIDKLFKKISACSDLSINLLSNNINDCYRRIKPKQIFCQDHGISQINKNTIKLYNLDIDRLIVDLDYSIRAGFLVLEEFKRRYSKREKRWWSRYNSSSRKRRVIYEKLIIKKYGVENEKNNNERSPI